MEIKDNLAAGKSTLEYSTQRATLGLRTEKKHNAQDRKLVAITRQDIVSQEPPRKQIILARLKFDVN